MVEKTAGPLDLTRPTTVHVVGIGGAGMSAIASVLAAMGHTVTGSDVKESPVTERLRAEGITVLSGHRRDHVADVDVITFSPAVRSSNPEMAAAREQGARVVPRGEVLAAIAALRRCIAVAGTHGKTTTASMLALTLVEAGMRPSFLIGADVNDVGTNAVWDSGEWLVLEADESYGTFASLRPEITVVTNVEPDHLDHYKTFDNLVEAFAKLLRGTSGTRVVCADDQVAASLGRGFASVAVGESNEADVRLAGIETGRSSVHFDLVRGSEDLGRFDLAVPGLHNVRNAALASVGAEAAGASLESAKAALARFAGVPRRFEFRGEVNGVTFVDDYAHLPSEVELTLATARRGGWSRVVVVFQPHRYTRTAALASGFSHSFDDADALVVTDVYSAGESPIPGVSGQLVVDAVKASDRGPEVTYVARREDLRGVVASMLRPGDVCCTLGAGDLTTLPDELESSPQWGP